MVAGVGCIRAAILLRHWPTALAACPLPPDTSALAGGMVLPFTHGACGYSWQCWLRRVLGPGDAQMETDARSAWRQVIEVTVVDRVSG